MVVNCCWVSHSLKHSLLNIFCCLSTQLQYWENLALNRNAQFVFNWKKKIKCNHKAFPLLSESLNAGCVMTIVNCFSWFFFFGMFSLFDVVGLKHFSPSFSSGRNLNRELILVLFHCSTFASLPCTLIFLIRIISLLQRKITGGYVLLLIFLCHAIRGWLETGQGRTKKIF